MKTLRILHAPTTVGGNPQGLSAAEKELGYNSHTVALEQNYFNYTVDEVICRTDDNMIIKNLKLWEFILKNLNKYDVFHFNFGRSIAPIRAYPGSNNYSGWKVFLYSGLYSRIAEFGDARLARRLKKVIAITWQGDDARQGDFCRSNFAVTIANEVDDDYYSPRSDVLKRRRIEKADRIADLLYSVNPDLMHVLPKRTKFTPYASVDPRKWQPVFVAESPEIPHVVHAPSDRKVKGTKYILRAFKRLEAEGIPFRYTLVEGKPHAEARKIYETADLLVDQLLAGWYGGLAVELMALGKPAICYIREEDMKFIPPGMHQDLPLIQATPDTIYEVLKEWLTTRKKELRPRGKQSRAYVEKWHDPVKIARDVTKDYERVWGEKHSSKRKITR